MMYRGCTAGWRSWTDLSASPAVWLEAGAGISAALTFTRYYMLPPPCPTALSTLSRQKGTDSI